MASSAFQFSGSASAVDAANDQIKSCHTGYRVAFSPGGGLILIPWVLKSRSDPACLGILRQTLDHCCPFKWLLFNGPNWVVLTNIFDLLCVYTPGVQCDGVCVPTADHRVDVPNLLSGLASPGVSRHGLCSAPISAGAVDSAPQTTPPPFS